MASKDPQREEKTKMYKTTPSCATVHVPYSKPCDCDADRSGDTERQHAKWCQSQDEPEATTNEEKDHARCAGK